MFGIVKSVFAQFARDKCPRLAAALAYYTVFSLAPLLILITAGVGAVLNSSDVGNRLADQIQQLVGPEAGKQIAKLIESAGAKSGKATAGIVSAIALAFGATGVLVQLQDALNTVWGVKPKRSKNYLGFLIKRLVSLAMLAAVAFLLLISLAVDAAISTLGNQLSGVLPGDISQGLFVAVQFTASLAVMGLLFAGMFKFLPDARIAWRDVWLGAAVTAVLFGLGKLGISFYLGNADVGSAYGAAGSLVLIMFWVYCASMIFLLGAEFTEVWAGRHNRRIAPEEHAEMVVRDERDHRDPELAAQADDARQA